MEKSYSGWRHRKGVGAGKKSQGFVCLCTDERHFERKHQVHFVTALAGSATSNFYSIKMFYQACNQRLIKDLLIRIE